MKFSKFIGTALLGAESDVPGCLLDTVIGDMAGYTSGAEQNDDIIILANMYRKK